MCVAKGITGGYLPLAATLTTQAVFDAFLDKTDPHKTFYHGHTYTGNALGCAAAIASLDLFEQNKILESLPQKIELIAAAFARWANLPFVGNLRHCGLMGGIELVQDKHTKTPFAWQHKLGAKVCAAMRPKGAMLRPLGNVIVLMPPPAIDMETLTQLLNIMENTLKNDLPDLLKKEFNHEGHEVHDDK
jgi:adenosylmethionine-8-amino-7-oxononanoate aminotransferase